MKNKSKGITLIEVIAGTLIISVIFYTISSFTSNLAFKYKHGFVELENFRVAHRAISQLRRDFNMSCPYVTSGDGIEELKKFLATPLAISKGDGKFVGANRRIRITPQQITFFKFADTSFSMNPQPLVEEVEYDFASASGILTRSCNGNVVKFNGFKEVEFKSFVHLGNPRIPVLWARIVLDSEFYKGSGKLLELTVSIASNFVIDSINQSDWQYRTFHQIK
ncbi:MAG: hypothetical protein KKB51_18075 [Candidatus Riflebacteria bacterium]|nr:hypothetical protein [Candidatus Riflebacteria bacterium]